jgi:WD40 repeat protein
MLTACEKTVTVWDLVTLNVGFTLKAHKDEVRTMHIVNDMLFTGGKGLTNSGSLLIWDLRNLDPNKPQEEK